MANVKKIRRFLTARAPFDLLSASQLDTLLDALEPQKYRQQERIIKAGEAIAGLYIVASGVVKTCTVDGTRISLHHRGDMFPGLSVLDARVASHDAICVEAATLYVLALEPFFTLVEAVDDFRAFFDRRATRKSPSVPVSDDMVTMSVVDLMTRNPVAVAPDMRVKEAAQCMHNKSISSVLVCDQSKLVGILTTADLTRLLAKGQTGDNLVQEAMTSAPHTLGGKARGMDAFLLMLDKDLGHLPIVENGQAIGIVTRSSLLRQRQASPLFLINEIARGTTTQGLAQIVERTPQLLSRLVGSSAEPHVIARLITDVTDALTRRLIALAEATLGPAPVAYAWLACGSQGRQEQTGVSDQDNCLLLHDDATAEHDAYFSRLARFVCDGLNACGFYYCPGDMMAIVDKWRQPLRVWRDYFSRWIHTPDPMAQMLASVMFDLRPIAGDVSLFAGLHEETLAAAQKNSIFIAHMVANSLKHHPPLGLFRGFALIRSGEHKNTVDLKLNGVIPVTDLSRLYALMGKLTPVNTRERLVAARDKGVISGAGAHDLIDAYDFIAETRLRHQARQIRAATAPDNFMAPATLSELERNHLRDAFAVVKTMQSAAAQGRGVLI